MEPQSCAPTDCANDTGIHISFMRRAIALAKKGEGLVNPNPLVGAVIAKGNEILASGFHHEYGSLHAERDALKNCRDKGLSPQGATMYVTLEPCCHTGKQPPCAQAIVEAGIKKVYVGSSDPNPLVAGKGVAFLKENGVQVEQDFLRDECDELNFIFFHYITTKRPYIALKYAMTADGKIATKAGKSKWISSEKSRLFVYSLRNKYSCIMTGIGTVLADDPMLTCRLEHGEANATDTPSATKNPVRVICDTRLRIPTNSKIVRTAKEVPTIVACTCTEQSENASPAPPIASAPQSEQAEKIEALQNAGVEILRCPPAATGGIDLGFLAQRLAEKQLDSVLIEGGAQINYSALEAGIVNRIYAFIAPKIFGGSAPSPVGGSGASEVEQAFALSQKSFAQCGSDILIEYEVNRGTEKCSQA